MAALSADLSLTPKNLKACAMAANPMQGLRLSREVSVRVPKTLSLSTPKTFHVVAMDFGIKQGLIDCLKAINAQVTLVPGDYSPEEIFALKLDGLFLSSGPGDPQTETSAVRTVRALLGKIPIFGVCLGHQILAQALGYETYKLKFGHRGSNQAVRCRDGQLITTAQNHGFAVTMDPAHPMALATNVSDLTNEGLEASELFAYSVQFHPEGAPGPLDALFYFEEFQEMMETWKKRRQRAGYASVQDAL